MEMNVEQLSNLERKLSVTIPSTDVDKTYNQIFQSIQKQYSQPGFRQGKVPIAVIKTKFADKVDQDVLEYLIGPAYAKAIQENSLEPVAQPEIKFDNVKQGHDFKFTALFEVKPNITVENVTGFEVEKEILNVTSDKVDEVIENLRNSRAKEEPMGEDRPVTNGEVAVINFDGYIDGEPLPGGKAENHPLELGSNSFIPGFEEGVVGMKVNDEKDIKLTFPEDYHAKDIAGKEVTFKVKLIEIKVKVLPEVNEEFAQDVGEHETVEAMREAIKKTLVDHEAKRIDDDVKNQILKVFVEKNPVEVPKILLKEQKKLLIQDTERRMQSQGFFGEMLENYMKDHDSELEETSAFIIQSSYLINALAEKEGFKVEASDRNEYLRERAAELGMEAAQLKSFYDKDEARARLDFQIIEQKVMNHILSQAKIKEVEKREE